MGKSLVFVISLLICISLSVQAPEKTSKYDGSIDKTDRFNTFDWALSKAVGARAKENVVLSPISVKLVLAMLYEGANGNTSLQLEDVLNIARLTRSFTPHKFSTILKSLLEAPAGNDITIGTKLFVDQEAKPKKMFQKKIEDLYNATIESINFKNAAEAVSKINDWAQAVSKGHIQHLLSEADARESTVMLLLNAVYFKGLWQNPFQVNATKEDIFYKDDFNAVKVPFMNALFNLKYIESNELNASILRLPYMGEKFAMYIILPFEKNGLQDVLANVNPDKLRALLPTMMEVPVQVHFPKFSFEFAASLSPILQQLGITDMFSSEADLKDIADSPKELVVSNVIQKAGIHVNEQGSTAYATTVVDLASKFGENTVEFKASHPFLFFIEDETTNTVVFVGKITDPSAAGKPQVQGAPAPQVIVGGDGLVNRIDQTFPALLDQQTFSYFDIEMLQSLTNTATGNWVTSPSSIKSVLALIIEGAQGNTLQELTNLLRLPQNKSQAQSQLRVFHEELKKGSVDKSMKTATRLLMRKDLQVKPKYEQIASENYDVSIERGDFSNPTLLAKQINRWISDYTQGLIPQILDPGLINANSSLMLINAIHFKGQWKTQFDLSSTHLTCFYPSPNECRKAEFMKTSGFFKYGYVISLAATLIEISYSDPRYSMIIVLPLERDGLSRTIRNLPFNSLFPVLQNLPYSEINLIMPKFSIEYSADLVPLLEKLGAAEMCSDRANLEDMLQPSKIKTSVSSFIHKAKILVNERGTIASAATAAIAETLMSRQTLQFKADHPFVFFIRDVHTGFIFEGILFDPVPSENQLTTNIGSQSKSDVTDAGKSVPINNSPYPPPANNKNNIPFLPNRG
uniref:Secreted Serpin protein n=1 Tax=Pristhesancus plagipennis TaxID=1955184 RepID=A0A2K8JMB0_PRIPG|nr:secreted Serpin protein [Pristhesancus plagipennis]